MHHTAIPSVVVVLILTLTLGTPAWAFGRGRHVRHPGGAPWHVGFGHGFHYHPFQPSPFFTFHRHLFLTPPLVPFHHTVIPPSAIFPHQFPDGVSLGFRRGWVPGHWVFLHGVWLWQPRYWAIIDP